MTRMRPQQPLGSQLPLGLRRPLPLGLLGPRRPLPLGPNQPLGPKQPLRLGPKRPLALEPKLVPKQPHLRPNISAVDSAAARMQFQADRTSWAAL